MDRVVAERWTPVQFRELVVASAVSAVALLINPYGYKLVWYPAELLSHQRLIVDKMAEWQSVDFHTLWGKLALFMILGLLSAAWFSPEPWKRATSCWSRLRCGRHCSTNGFCFLAPSS